MTEGLCNGVVILACYETFYKRRSTSHGTKGDGVDGGSEFHGLSGDFPGLDFYTNSIYTLYGEMLMRSTTINLSLPIPLLRLVDREAKAELRTRSELLREAARAYLAREERWKGLQRYARQRAMASGIRSEADVLRMIDSVRRSTHPL